MTQTNPNRKPVTPLRDGVTVGVGTLSLTYVAQVLAGPLIAWVDTREIPGLDIVGFEAVMIAILAGAFALGANYLRNARAE